MTIFKFACTAVLSTIILCSFAKAEDVEISSISGERVTFSNNTLDTQILNLLPAALQGKITQAMTIQMAAPAGTKVTGEVTPITANGVALKPFPVEFLNANGKITKVFRPAPNNGGALSESEMLAALQELFPGVSRAELESFSQMSLAEFFAYVFPSSNPQPITKLAIIHKDACRSDLSYQVKFIVNMTAVPAEALTSGITVDYTITNLSVAENRRTLVKPVSEKGVPVFLMQAGSYGGMKMNFIRWRKNGAKSVAKSYAVSKLYGNRDGIFARQYVDRRLMNGKRATVELIGPNKESIYGVCVKMRGREELNGYRK